MRIATMAAVSLYSVSLCSVASADAWDDIAHTLWGDRPMTEGVVTLEAPMRAHDAALVPVTMHLTLPEGDDRRVERVTLVVDENPAPVAGTFTLGEMAEITMIETRLRVNAYSSVHAVAELSDGSLHVTETFVKAAGGCSAPMLKDPEEAMANLGRMRLRDLGAGSSPDRRTAQLMIRHPNNSGFQRDPITLYYIPPHFVSDVTVAQGDDLIFAMEGGISMSEDPSFRFDYRPNGEAISVKMRDTEDLAFSEAWQTVGG